MSLSWSHQARQAILLASSMYAACGLWADAANMRRLVKDKGVKVVAGYSLVRVGDKACNLLLEMTPNDKPKRYILWLSFCIVV